MNHTLHVGASLVAVLATCASAQIAVDWATVGNAGNASDPSDGDSYAPGLQSLGSVGYEYRIGKFQVTNAQYAAFLNAVAASDPNGLYDAGLSGDPRRGILRSGSVGSYTYSVKPNMGDKPATDVGFKSAARMCNWMTNGQGSGDTESGVYTFDGNNIITAVTRDLNNPNQVFIPTEDEWYKAAYHQPAAQGGDADDYWLYATRSNSVPTVATATATGDIANPGPGVVNYADGADWNGQDGNVTTVGSAGNSSFYIVFDMNGNVWEWNESKIPRGGSFTSSELLLRSSSNFNTDFAAFEYVFGFRFASPIPAPPSAALLGLGGLMAARRRRA